MKSETKTECWKTKVEVDPGSILVIKCLGLSGTGRSSLCEGGSGGWRQLGTTQEVRQEYTFNTGG